jgi:uncharacterized protein YajQ (UPF0234 family)
MPSFDIVSELDLHEIENAVQQAQKEVGTRFDFRGTDTEIERTDDGILLRANSEGRIEAALLVLKEKLAKRKVSQRTLDPQKVEPAAKGHYKQLVKLKKGISKEKAKDVVQFIKDSKLRCRARSRASRSASPARRRTTCRTSSRPCGPRTSTWTSSSPTSGIEGTGMPTRTWS